MNRQPFSSTMTVREARDQYLAENGFTLEGYDAKWTDASFFGVRFRVPNTDSHRVGIMLHDLHHVATGFGTDLVGEGEISAWEAHRGLAPVGLYVASIVTAGAFMGLLLSPRRAMRAWRRASHAGTTLFPFARLPREQFAVRYEDLLSKSVGQLRAMLSVPDEGLADRPRKLHTHAPHR